MRTRPITPLKSMLHPYIFVLKEGRRINKDFLDYSLMMLYTHAYETIPSPMDDLTSQDKKESKKEQPHVNT